LRARRVARALLLGCALAWSASASPAAPGTSAPDGPNVVVLSFDGVRPDALDDAALDAFARVAREGVRAESLVPVFPSSTFPNHVALATGAPVDVHGIVGNRFRDADLGDFDYGEAAAFLQAEPLWAAAERQGVRAATFFWVGSETPWRGTAATYRKAPFDGDVGEAEKVDQILAWLDLPAERRPRLILSWWHGADAAGHRHGPRHEDTVAMLRGQDRQLGRLLRGFDARGLWASTTLVLVSDHGMVAVRETHDLGDVLEAAGIGAYVVHASAVANVHLDRPEQASQAVRVLSAVPGVTAWRREDLPARLRYDHPRAGDVVAIAEPGVALWKAWRGLDLLHRAGAPFGLEVGAHGYDPEATREVHAIFLAMGRGVAQGRVLGPQRTLDVAATVAALLGIDPPGSSEGHPIPLAEGAAIRAAPAAARVR